MNPIVQLARACIALVIFVAGGAGATPTLVATPVKLSADTVATTSLAGNVRTSGDKPLANVRLEIGDASAQSGSDGHFVIDNVTPGAQILVIDGRKAGSHGKQDFGYYEAQVSLAANRANALPFTSYLPKIDHAHEVTIPSPTVAPVVIGTPKVPGLELHIPAGMVIKDPDGNIVTKVGITPIPLDRPPFPLPTNVYVPIYFTAQPGNSAVYTTSGGQGYAQVYYPNYQHELPGARGTFWKYDPDTLGWLPYGLGTVNPTATQVVPNADTRIYEFAGAMFNGAGGQPTASGPNAGGSAVPGPRGGNSGGNAGSAGAPGRPGANPKDGEPVDLGTGLFVQTQVDLQLSDVTPLLLTRTYRQNDFNIRDFGIGITLSYDLYLWSANQYQEVDILMPDGGKVHFVRTSPGTGYTDAVFVASAAPSKFYKSVMAWNGNGWNVTLTDGTLYVFGENAPLQTMQDRFGNRITLVRSGGVNSPISQITSTNGKSIQFTRDSSSRITQAKDNAGRTVGYVYDASGRLSTVTDPNNGVTTYTWDANNRVQSIQDARLNTFVTNVYDANGRVFTQTTADGGVTQFVYTLDGGGNVVETDVTDPRGAVRKVTFNAAHYWLTDNVAVGTPQEQDYSVTRDPVSNYPMTHTDALGRQTTWVYDTNGNVTKVTALAGTPNAISSNFTYSTSYSQRLTSTDPLTHTTTFQRNALGQLTAIVDPLIHSTSFAYEGQGQVTTVTDALNHATQFTYDHGDPATVTDPLSHTVKLFADPVGRTVALTDALANRMAFLYDPINGVHQVTDPNGGVTTTNYDPLGRAASVADARTGTTVFTYDTKNRMIIRRDPLLATDTFTSYDFNDNLLTATDRKGQVVTYAYDPLNRIATAAYADGATVIYTWDKGNRLTQLQDSAGGTITRGYDGLDRLTSETTAQGTVGYTYDAAGRRTKLTVPGQSDVIYTYDNANRLTKLVQGTSTVLIGYDNANRRTSMTLANGIVTTYAYDNASHLTGITYKLGTATVGTLTYGYNLAGRLISRSGTLFQSVLPAALTSASYNAANRLLSWATSGGTTSPAYDSNGNMTGDGTRTLTWDARNRLTAISGTTASFTYDGTGRRTLATLAGSTTSYLYDGTDIVQEQSGGTPSATLMTGLGIDERFGRTAGGTQSSYLTDNLGSTVALADSGGTVQTIYSYDAFGVTAVASGTVNSSRYQYTGRENDGASGLYYSRARYYNPAWGRFISEDPIGLAGGYNLYRYAISNPLQKRDAMGLSSSDLDDTPPSAPSFVRGGSANLHNALSGVSA